MLDVEGVLELALGVAIITRAAVLRVRKRGSSSGRVTSKCDKTAVPEGRTRLNLRTDTPPSSANFAPSSLDASSPYRSCDKPISTKNRERPDVYNPFNNASHRICNAATECITPFSSGAVPAQPSGLRAVSCESAQAFQKVQSRRAAGVEVGSAGVTRRGKMLRASCLPPSPPLRQPRLPQLSVSGNSFP